MADGTEIPAEVKKVISGKIVGIPFAVAAGVVVVGALLYSWWKKRKAGTAAVSADTAAAAPGGNSTDSQPLFLAHEPTPPVLTSTNQPATNEDWRRQAIQWLISNKQLSSTDAARIIDDYLAGNQQSQADGAFRDAVVNVLGLPPTIPSGGTTVNPPKAAKQGTPPLLHYVQGTGDTTFLELSWLYFGNAGYVAAIQAANPNAAEPLTPGTAVQIPAVNAPPAAGGIGAPKNLRIGHLTTGGFDLGWDGVAGATQYQVALNGRGIADPTARTAFVGPLQPGTQYTVTVRAYSNGAYGPWSEPKYVTTLRK